MAVASAAASASEEEEEALPQALREACQVLELKDTSGLEIECRGLETTNDFRLQARTMLYLLMCGGASNGDFSRVLGRRK